MDIRIKTTDYEITSEVSAYIDERIKTLEKFLGDNAALARCEVEVGRDAGRPRHGANIWFAEIRVIQPGEKAVYARNNASSVNAAIDDVKEEVERQIRSGKKLHVRMARKTGAAIKKWIRLGSNANEN